MKKNNDPFNGVFNVLRDKSLPTDEQKEKMLNHVLMENRRQDNSVLKMIGRWIAVYPWRFAFSASAVQAIIFTLIFGTEYTNIFLRAFGG